MALVSLVVIMEHDPVRPLRTNTDDERVQSVAITVVAELLTSLLENTCDRKMKMGQ
jgi:hypothetical protein